MKYISIVISLLIISIISFVFCLYGYNSEILRNTRTPTFIKSLVIVFFPPTDLYTPLEIKKIEAPFPLNTEFLSFQNKYLGSHRISIYYDDIDTVPYFEKIDLSSVIECYTDDQLSFNKNIVHGEPFLGKDGSGLMLSIYSVPEDLPLNKLIKCKVYISSIDINKLAQYGKGKFSVQKFSDL